MACEIRRLQPDDERGQFDSGQPDLDRFFRETAGQHQFKRHISVTYVATVDGAIGGFLTLLAAAMTAGELAFESRKWPRQHLPVLRLARLATDRRFERQGIGAALTRFAMQETLAMRDRFGCVALVVDPKTDAVGFYAKIGFVVVGTAPPDPRGEPPPMLIAADTIAKAVERAR